MTRIFKNEEKNEKNNVYTYFYIDEFDFNKL